MEMMVQNHTNTERNPQNVNQEDRNPKEKHNNQVLHSEEQRRKEWISQQKKIINTYENLRSRSSKVPSIEELAQETGLSNALIQKHIAELDIESLLEPAKLSLPAIIDRIAYQASCGSLDAAKLYFQLIYEWKEQPMRAVKGNARARRRDEMEKEVSQMTDQELIDSLIPVFKSYLDDNPKFIEDYLKEHPELAARISLSFSQQAL